MESYVLSSSLYDLRRQSELPSPHDLRGFIRDAERRPSLLEREYETCRCCSLSPKIKAYKNVLGAGLSFMLILSSVVALIALQSSLNNTQGLGLATLAIINIAFLVSGVFASSIIRLLGTKYSIVLSYLLALVYVLTNFYPQWYTLVPGAICFGVAQGPFFAAINVHATTMAIKYAPDLKENSDYLVALFTGIITMFFKLAYIPGNLASTLILFSERNEAGKEIVDTSLGSVCNNTEVDELDPTYVYILISSFVLLAISATVIAVLFVDHLGTEIRKKPLLSYVKNPIIATFKMFLDWKIYMLLPMMTTDSFISASVAGKLSKFYISDCIGVHWIGLFSMTYGVSSAVAAVTTGRLAKYIPQFMMVYSSSALLLATFLFLQFWEREPSYLIAFLPTAIIGSAEGMWHTVPPTLVGILYPDKKEPAFSVLRMALAVGYLIGFLVALFFEIAVTLWVGIGLVVASLVTYSVLVFAVQTRKQILPCCYLRERPQSSDTKSSTVDSETKSTIDETTAL